MEVVAVQSEKIVCDAEVHLWCMKLGYMMGRYNPTTRYVKSENICQSAVVLEKKSS